MKRLKLDRGRAMRAVAWMALGALAGFGIAPFGLWPLTILALAIFFAKAGSGFRRFWLFGFGYFALTLWWIVEPFLVDIARHGALAPFGLFAMCGGMALFWGLGGWLMRRLHLSGPFAAAAVIALAELVRARVFTGFPWAMPGEIWIDTPIAQYGAWGGPLGLTFLTLGLAAALAWLGPRARAMAVPGGIAALWAASLALFPALPDPTGGPLVRMVQPNIAQADKWRPETVETLIPLMRDLSVGGATPDLVVWPESATPWLLEDARGLFEAIAEESGAPLMVGAVSLRGEEFFNSLALVEPDVPLQVYDKVHLVPFGEYIPFGETLSQWGISGFAARDGAGFDIGTGPGRLDVPGIGWAQALICYEGIFAPEVRAAVNAAGARPRLMVLVTNDAWFGRFAGPYQHLVQARMRAIELGLPMVRVGNNGVSAMIDPRGRMTASLPLDQAGRLDALLPQALGATPYARFGDWPAFAAIFLLLGVLITIRARKPH